MRRSFPLKASASAIGLAVITTPLWAQSAAHAPADAASAPAAAHPEPTLPRVMVTAKEALKQAPGVSTVTAEDLEQRPPANDLSEILRTMPGVNLTGNSASGQYGNNRQIDLRGMGPENTLILIDGKPVHSRDSVRMGRSGERNTRGDTNWIPADAVESIEVIRGPAAARYGSGAAGGVINIITRAPSQRLSGSVSTYYSAPDHSAEGGTQRLGFNLSGPVVEGLSFRLHGNVAKTDADDLSLNAAAAGVDPSTGATPPAGREGVRNRDLNGLVRWDVMPTQVVELEAGVSRQGNIYAGDRAVSTAGTALLNELARAGAETNVMLRRTASVTHRGTYGFGTSRLIAAFEGTDNTRLNEGLAGNPEGSINSTSERSTSQLKNTTLIGELNLPLHWGVAQTVSLGGEYRREQLDDPFSMSQSTATGGAVPGAASGTRDGKSSADNVALFVEDNLRVNDSLTLTPGVRVDAHSQFGHNLSPSLNASQKLGRHVTLKGGVARAFKAPNLYQSNPNYLYYTRGNGCPVDLPSLGTGCYVQGNAELSAETSLNKEIGIAYAGPEGLNAGLTYFHNDYKNKIVAGLDQVALTSVSGRVFQWQNAPKALVQGFEGNLDVPLLGRVGRTMKLINNFTYMIENKNKTTGEALSIIPQYTVNSTLDWQATPAVSAIVTATFYGRQKPRNMTSTGAAATGALLQERGPYHLLGASVGYAFSPKLKLRVGVSNLLDKRLYRQSNSGQTGANSYNEPGRAYYVTLNAGF